MLAGTVLGTSRVIKQSGAGGIRAVCSAIQTTLGRGAALKDLHPDMSARLDTARWFFNR